MDKSRLEAFSDGVVAIIITIMVLELKVPHGDQWVHLQALWPVFLSYVLSFVMVGIYWNSHHHVLHTVRRVSGGILWANLHFLFWLSLTPFTTGWVGENHFSALPMALYCFNLLMDAIGFRILATSIIRSHGQDSDLAKAFGRDRKGLVSAMGYLVAIPLALSGWSWIAFAITVVIALVWFIPDRRIEQSLGHSA